MLLILLVPSIASASDYVHQCRSADGYYVMQEDELRRLDPARGAETGPAIAHRVLRRIELSKRTGYCIANGAPQGSRRFDYSASVYALQVHFRQVGRPVETFLLCEMASNDLPAAYNCDRDVETLNWTMGASPAPGGDDRGADAPRWMHNGSVMRIVAEGSRRRIEYASPRSGLAGRGVGPGTVLFEGARDGDRYYGRAYFFSTDCGAVAYEVDGDVGPGERRLVLKGRVPRLDGRCRAKSWRDDTLVFERR
ncbi:MAG: hypothetical protein KKB37_01360 [Alphaproteobacteria bacterium]|nr:hypothetical protein [Alphaproteobacteria bacterium]